MKLAIPCMVFMLGALLVPRESRCQWVPLDISSNLTVNVFASGTGGLYVGTDAGVFRTSDGGTSWQPRNTGLVWGGMVLPSVLSLTGFFEIFIAGTDGHGMYRSTDSGEHWVEADSGLDGKTVYALTWAGILDTGYAVFAGTDNGVYVSDNWGVSWRRLNTGLPESRFSVYALTVDPGHAHVFAATSAGLYQALYGHAPVAWYRADSSLRDTNVVALTSTVDHVFAATARGSVFKSLVTDGGSYTWIDETNGLPIDSVRQNVIAIDAYGDTLIASGGGGIHISTDQGTHWTAAGSGLPRAGGAIDGYKALLITNSGTFAGAAGSSEYVSAAASLGVYRSTTGGTTWQTANAGLSHDYLYLYPGATAGTSVSVGSASKNIMDGRSALYRSTDDGAKWARSDYYQIDPRGMIAQGDSLIAATLSYPPDQRGIYASGIVSSTDGGATWTMHTDSAWRMVLSTEFDYKAGISVLAIDNGTMYGATLNAQVYRSSNFGVTWETLDTSMQHPLSAASALYVSGNDLRAATVHGVYRSTLGDPNWFPDTSGVGAVGVNGFLPHGNDLLAASKGSTLDASVAGGVYILHNGATSWAAVDAGLPAHVEVRDLLNCRGNVFAATDHGVFRSANSGISWESVWDGMNDTSVTWLAATNDYLYAASTSGIYRRLASEVVGIDPPSGEGTLPGAVSLLQNYPDPFTHSTAITYDLPVACDAKLTVLNTLGESVLELVSGFQRAGRHNVSMTSSGLKSGVYWCVLAAGNITLTRCMIVVR